MHRKKGQALVEYVLMLLVTLFLVTTITVSLRKTIIRLWGFYTKMILPPCPGCPLDRKYRLN